jgi:nucleoside-diphosphate kinase
MAAEMDERYAFIAEWYDPNASFIRRYQLIFYLADNTVEMYDIKNRRLFLKRSKCPTVKFSDLFLGAVVNVHSRQLTIVDFGDEFTTKKLRSKKEKTFGLIKPDCVGKMGEILQRASEEGFVLTQLKMVQLSQKEAADFYREHEGKPFFSRLLDYVTRGPVVAFEMMGADAVGKWREVLGPTDSSVARQDAPSSIRAQFGTDKTRNACHGSDSVESAKREAEFFFGARQRKNTAKFRDSTLGIIKPHAVISGLTGPIMKQIVSTGLEITAVQLHNVEKANAQEFYEVYKGVVAEYNQMVEELSSGPCVTLEVIGDNAHGAFRELTGPSDPEIARHLRPHTIRAKFGQDKIKNALHCTDLPDDSILEVEYFFKILDS